MDLTVTHGVEELNKYNIKQERNLLYENFSPKQISEADNIKSKLKANEKSEPMQVFLTACCSKDISNEAGVNYYSCGEYWGASSVCDNYMSNNCPTTKNSYVQSKCGCIKSNIIKNPMCFSKKCSDKSYVPTSYYNNSQTCSDYIKSTPGFCSTALEAIRKYPNQVNNIDIIQENCTYVNNSIYNKIVNIDFIFWIFIIILIVIVSIIVIITVIKKLVRIMTK